MLGIRENLNLDTHGIVTSEITSMEYLHCLT